MNNQNEFPQKRLFSAREYMMMAEAELLPEHGVELIAGEIYQLPPITEPETRVHCEVMAQLIQRLPREIDFSVRGRATINGGDWNWPEADIAVIHPHSLHPTEPPAKAILIVEISKLTLQYDRTTKVNLYASLGIADYWIVNLVDNKVEVYRQPIESASAQFGHDYASRQIYQRGQSISLLEMPEVSIDVDVMLPQVA